MLEEKITIKLLSKRFAGNNMKLLFGDQDGIRKVLILKDLVAFREIEFKNIDSYLLQVRKGQSVYGLDPLEDSQKKRFDGILINYLKTILTTNKDPDCFLAESHCYL